MFYWCLLSDLTINHGSTGSKAQLSYDSFGCLFQQLARVVEGWKNRDAEKDEILEHARQEKDEVIDRMKKQEQVIYGPQCEKTCLQGFANIKGADQLTHLHSLISAFVISLLESIIIKLATSKISLF